MRGSCAVHSLTIASAALAAALLVVAAQPGQLPRHDTARQEHSVDLGGGITFRRFQLRAVRPHSSSSSSPSSASCPCGARAVELREEDIAAVSPPGGARPEQSLRRHVLRVNSEDCRVIGDGSEADDMRVESKRHDRIELAMRTGAWWTEASHVRTSQQGARPRSPWRPNSNARARRQQTAATVVALMARLAPAGSVESQRWMAGAFEHSLHCGGAHFQAQDAFLVTMHLSERVTLPTGEHLSRGAWLLLARTPSSADFSRSDAPTVSCFYKEADKADDPVSSLGALRPVVVALRQAASASSTNQQSTSTPQTASAPPSSSKGGTSVWAWLGIIPAAFAGIVIIAAIVTMYLKSRKPREEPKPWPASPIASRKSNFLGETQGTKISRPDVGTFA
jgi:hypothetical protein